MGESLTIDANWVQTFDQSFIGRNYNMTDLPVEVPLVCEMTYKSEIHHKGFLISAEKERVFASVKQRQVEYLPSLYPLFIEKSLLNLGQVTP